MSDTQQHRIPVFYNTAMQTSEGVGYSPSGGKPKLVVEDWQERFRDEIEVIESTPVERADIKLAHGASYVDSVMDLRIPNGFGKKSAALAATLPHTTGSLLSAATHVISGASPVAASPTSGFHHAHYSDGHGFCTFNGLAITAMKLKALGLVEKVGILDMDQHYGDGTDNIIERKGLGYVTHITTGRGGYAQEDETIANLRRLLLDWFGPMLDSKCILLYQAGADCHVDDPLGGWLTTEQMIERDRMVFRFCQSAELPVVWNLAGGYQRDASGGIEPVVALHRNTMLECIAVYGADE